MTGIFRGIATLCFGTDPEVLAELGVQAEAAGLDGFFIWDHILFAKDGEGSDILDPWVVLALVAARPAAPWWSTPHFVKAHPC